MFKLGNGNEIQECLDTKNLLHCKVIYLFSFLRYVSLFDNNNVTEVSLRHNTIDWSTTHQKQTHSPVAFSQPQTDLVVPSILDPAN